jgi:type I restriction enzyme, S subunit
VRAGDVLVSTVRPERRTIGYVRGEDHDAVCTTGFAVLTPQKIHPVVLAHALRSTFVTGQLLRNNVGIAYPAIDESCLPDVVLPFTAEQIAALEDAV